MNDLEQMAREFFHTYRPLDAQWYIDGILVPAMTHYLAKVREEDARLCEEESQSAHLTDDPWDRGYKQACINNAAAIREKGRM